MRGEQTDWPKLMVRLPPDAKAWVAQEAEKFGNSQNAEIVRAIRERMDRAKAATGEKFGDRAPAAAPSETALQGGPITHGL